MFPVSRRSTALALAGACAAVLMAGCADKGDSAETHEHTQASDDAAAEPDDAESVDPPDSAPAPPDVSELSARGFDCRELPAGDWEDGDVPEWYDGQSHLECLLSDGTIAASWDMVIYRDKVISWTYYALPIGDPTDLNGLTLAHLTALQTVFDTLLPQDFAVLGPAVEQWTTPADTATWDFDGDQHVSVTGQGLVDFEATLVELPPNLSTSLRPGPTGPTFDPDEFLQSAATVGWDECEGEDRDEQWGYDIVCSVGDFTLAMNLRSDDKLLSFSITNFGSPDGAQLLDDLSAIAQQLGEDEFTDWVNELNAAARTGGYRYAWTGDLPTLITPLTHPDGPEISASFVALTTS